MVCLSAVLAYVAVWCDLVVAWCVQVTDFEWSHDGQMALICYKDSFVLVGSVAGQRYWSSMLNLEGCLVTCGIWTPDDQKVIIIILIIIPLALETLSLIHI